VGEILGRELPGGRLAVLKVIGFRRTTSLKVRGPAVRLQNWLGSTMPTEAEAHALQFLQRPVARTGKQTFGPLVLTAPRGRPLAEDLFVRPRLVVPLRPREERGGYICVSTWPPYTLDDILAAGLARWWADPDLSADAPAPWLRPAAAGPPVN
jgi:hypothetical protein